MLSVSEESHQLDRITSKRGWNSYCTICKNNKICQTLKNNLPSCSNDFELKYTGFADIDKRVIIKLKLESEYWDYPNNYSPCGLSTSTNDLKYLASNMLSFSFFNGSKVS